MGRMSERRALYYEDDPDYNPFVGVDVNEYLIEEYPHMTLKQRRAVWRLAQEDGDFNFDAVYEEIDAWVDYVMDNANKTNRPDSEAEDSTEVSDRSADQPTD